MGEVLGTIKFLENKIITKKNGIEEIWKRQRDVGMQFIQYKGYIYTLQNGNEVSNDESVEEDNDYDIDIFDEDI